MALTQLVTRAQLGIEAPEVRVEVHISNGLPAFTIVGLPEAAVREARDRVRSAIINTGFEFPAKRITVNLAPANLPKQGGRYDLAIALAILAASRQIDSKWLDGKACFGELALSGACRKVEGLLPAMLASKASGQSMIVAADNRTEAGLIRDHPIFLTASLAEVCASLNGGGALPLAKPGKVESVVREYPELADVRGQFHAKRALTIAAAGAHHLLMMGPPGIGKTMLASRLPGLLPPMTEAEALETASIDSISRQCFSTENWRQRPFRAPHHTISSAALAGGGSQPGPGEISLAHNGVLFLDELTEFDRRSIEVLREPLENGEIHISRAARQVTFPARFQLVGAMNPCPGGCESIQHCDCSAQQLTRYRDKLSAPLIDRIDIQIELAPVNRQDLMQETAPGDRTLEVRERVDGARRRQIERQACLNAELDSSAVERHCRPSDEEKARLLRAIEKYGLSARAYHKILKLARTIADLGQRELIIGSDINEALAYRRYERSQSRWRRSADSAPSARLATPRNPSMVK